MEIVSRAAARAKGLKRYFTGSPCKHGHVAERLEVNGSCCECARLKRFAAYHANIEEERRKQKVRRDADPNTASKKRARRARRDPGYAERSASWRAANEARRMAEENGESQYFTGAPCIRGHVANRFTKGGKCVECNRLSCRARHMARPFTGDPAVIRFRRSMAEIRAAAQKRAVEHAVKTRPWREAGVARRAAQAQGSKFYQGLPCPYGHQGVRYTSGGTCVDCAAIHASSVAKKEYDAKYAQENRDRIKKRARLYHERTREQRMLITRNWAAAHPELRRAIRKAYKARRRQQESGGDSTAIINKWERAAIKVCHWCGVKCPKLYHIDHYLPLSKGGRHEVQNLVIACRKCNLRKSARDPYDFAASMGRLF